jgi:hypothetical protein
LTSASNGGGKKQKFLNDDEDGKYYLCPAKKTLTSLGRRAFEETMVEKLRKKKGEKYRIHK